MHQFSSLTGLQQFTQNEHRYTSQHRGHHAFISPGTALFSIINQYIHLTHTLILWTGSSNISNLQYMSGPLILCLLAPVYRCTREQFCLTSQFIVIPEHWFLNSFGWRQSGAVTFKALGWVNTGMSAVFLCRFSDYTTKRQAGWICKGFSTD